MQLEADFSTIHNFLSRILRSEWPTGANPTSDTTTNVSPGQKEVDDECEKCPVDLEAVIAKADVLLAKYPPSEVMRYAEEKVQQSLGKSR